jgi:hypothetical protein
MMDVQQTERGFDFVAFLDFTGARCTLQHTPLGDVACVRLGMANTERMLLTREQVAELLPHLTRFVETGELG